MKKLFLILILAMPLLASAAKQPTDEQLKALCRDAGYALQTAASDDAKQQAFDALAKKLEAQADINKLTAAQVDLLFETGGISLTPYLSHWLEPVLDTKANKERGAFAYLAWKYLPREDQFHISEKEITVLKRCLDAGDLQKVLSQQGEAARDIINGIASFKDANWSSQSFHTSAAKFLACNMPDAAVLECVKVFNSVVYAESLTADTRDGIRQMVLAQYHKLQAKSTSERIKKNCQTQIDYLEGPFAKGTLIGGKAPQLHFLRMFKQQGDEVKELDFKDLHALFSQPNPPVVMLDFWATKCVPCVQSFPELAELQKHFTGKNVVILGITSLQGYFVDAPNSRTVQCRNNPEKELALFPDYMKGMGMNWTVAVTEEDVMNTEYGALAIPHIVLIDKKGNVRYNALTAEGEERIKLIEQLLNE